MKTILLSIAVFVTCISFGYTQYDVSLFYPWILQSCIKNCSWTKWFNVGKPYNSTSGDIEDTAEIIEKNPDTMCKAPLGMEAQSINYQTGDWNYEWRLTQTVDNTSLVSFHSTEPAGVDFRVRYCCSRDTFISTTTTTTVSTSLDNSTCGIQEVAPRSSIISRIFGEVEATANSWPWMIYLDKQTACLHEHCSLGCSAILIDKDYALTAAHCIKTTDPGNITLIAGAHNLSSMIETASRQIRSVQQVFLHPQYNLSSLDHDIAILRVNTSFTFTKYVQPACLPDDEIQSIEEVVSLHWENKQAGEVNNDILKQAYTTIVNNCSLFCPHVDDTKQLCTTKSIFSGSVCHDNGSGVILTVNRGQYIISGMASYVKECNTMNNQNKPNVYTRVSAYTTWINEIIE